jgi:hypothetical protein
MAKSKQPNSGGGKGGGSARGKTNTGRSSGPRMSDEHRADVTKTPSHKNPYPNGLS